METAERTRTELEAGPVPPQALLKDSRAFCMAPWLNLYIAIGGAASPCCEFEGDFGNVKDRPISDVWNGPDFAAFRAKMLRDERDSRCWKCYEKEAAGGPSMRHGFNAQTDGAGLPQVPPLPVTLDIRFSNLCNFACRSCGPAWSSKWFAEARQIGLRTPEEEPLVTTFSSTEAGTDALRPLLPTVIAINFAGGEPLVMESHYALLNELIALGRTDVTLTYITNLSHLRFGRQDVLALWSRFPNVYVGASIDASGARGELVREGLSWPNFVANVNAIKERCPHVRMWFSTTVSVLNVWSLPDLYRDLMALEGGSEREYSFNVLQTPRHYSVQILPKSLKIEIKRRLEEAARAASVGNAASGHSIGDKFQHVIDYMMAEDRTDLLERFRTVTLKLDAMRRKSTAAVCPELAPLLRPRAFPRLQHWMRSAPFALRRSWQKLRHSEMHNL